MDMFDVFAGSSPAPSKKGKMSGRNRGGYVERSGLVARMRDASVLFFDDDSQQEIFVPISQIKDWWFTPSGTKRNLRLQDLELDDEVTLVFPRWLAVKEGLV